MAKEYESVRHRMNDESHSNTASVNDRVRNVLKERYERAEHDHNGSCTSLIKDNEDSLEKSPKCLERKVQTSRENVR